MKQQDSLYNRQAAPHEVALKETPDTSVHYQFKFWDLITNTTPGIEFPTDTDLLRCYNRMAHYAGDELTYKILVDAERKQNIQPIVICSAIAPDTGANKRL